VDRIPEPQASSLKLQAATHDLAEATGQAVDKRQAVVYRIIKDERL